MAQIQLTGQLSLFRVSTDHFEGPLDALLWMIEGRKLDITQLSLARVAEDFIAYIESQEHDTLGELSDFLDIASKLLLIKSRALLPVLELTDEEEEEIEDLEKQLVEYQRCKHAAGLLQALYRKKKRSYARDAYVGVELQFSANKIPIRLDGNEYSAKFRQLLEDMPSADKLQKSVISNVMSLEEQIERIRLAIIERVSCTFFELTRESNSRDFTVVSFLAILELVRSEQIEVWQKKVFGDIELSFVRE